MPNNTMSPIPSRVCPFDPAVLKVMGCSSINDVSYCTVDSDVLPLISSMVHKGSDNPSRMVKRVYTQAGESDDEAEGVKMEDGKPVFRFTSCEMGLGVHMVEWEGESVWVVNQTVGAPVGTSCGASFLSSVVLLARGRGKYEFLQRLCEHLVRESQRKYPNTFALFHWNVKSGSWRFDGRRNARKLDSVVLPEAQRKKVIDDMSDFLSPSTRDYYVAKGIPYRRSYLFHGVPGTGKTSLIQALAGHFRRSVCFMQPTDPEFTDDMLKESIQRAPPGSIIVFEDIDALFTKERTNRGKSAVTFSGLLNALDGVAVPGGQVFVLTTNFREQLDPALIRNGRVDLHVEFGYITDEQIRKMYSLFFPAATAEDAEAFLRKVRESHSELTPAVLQHFFVVERKSTPQEVMDHLDWLKDEVAGRASDDSPGSKDSSDEDDDEDEPQEAASPAAEPPTHHFHLSISPTVMAVAVGAIGLPLLMRRL